MAAARTATPATHDAARRAFFREFGKQAVTAVGHVAAFSDILGRAPASAAASLLGLTEAPSPRAPTAARPVRPSRPSVTAALAATDDLFRSPYRLSGSELMLLDQRRIPEALEEVIARRGSDVAYYLRQGVCRGGPVMAQVAAYGLALTALERQGHPPEARALELRRTRNALAQARPSSRLTVWAIERMEAIEEDLGAEADGSVLAEALRAGSDGIAGELQVSLAAIAARTAELLAAPPDRPLSIIVHGDQGRLSGGLLGTGLAALQQLAEEGRELRVFVTEGRPFMDGARLASWELRQAGIGHKVVADAAVAWLLAREPIDAVLLDAAWVAENGDTAALIGSRAIAQQVAAAGEGPRLIVMAPAASIDPSTEDGSRIPADMRPAGDLSAFLRDVPIRAADALVPAADVVDATDIDALVTDIGVVSPVSGAAISALLVPGAGPAPDPVPSSD